MCVCVCCAKPFQLITFFFSRTVRTCVGPPFETQLVLFSLFSYNRVVRTYVRMYVRVVIAAASAAFEVELASLADQPNSIRFIIINGRTDGFSIHTYASA